MKILLAEYAVGMQFEDGLISEGRAMLSTLAASFRGAGYDLLTPEPGRFEDDLDKLAADSDYGLVIAPDEHLAHYTRIIEDKTVNLGSSPGVIEICADKLRTGTILSAAEIAVPDEARSDRYVIKPRWGCGSEDITVSDDPSLTVDEGFVRTGLIEGEHLSVSLIASKRGFTLPLTINRQIVKVTSNRIEYKGGITPYFPPRSAEIIEAGIVAGEVLGCTGYFGVDIVLADKPYIVDVNPRPTTSIIGIHQVIDHEIGDLILKARIGELPESINIIQDEVSYRLDEL